MRYLAIETPGAKFNMFCSPQPLGSFKRFSSPSKLGPRSSPSKTAEDNDNNGRECLIFSSSGSQWENQLEHRKKYYVQVSLSTMCGQPENGPKYRKLIRDYMSLAGERSYLYIEISNLLEKNYVMPGRWQGPQTRGIYPYITDKKFFSKTNSV